MSTRKKRYSLPEQPSGRFSALPDSVADSTAFTGASPRAIRMLFELLRQHDGKNNGHLQAVNSYLARRGLSSHDQNRKAIKELIERKLIVQTKRGGLNAGPSRYALTWLSVSNFTGLDIGQNGFIKGDYLNFGDPEKRSKPPAARDSTSPHHGTASASSVPQHGRVKANFRPLTVPQCGNNEVNQCMVQFNSAELAAVVRKFHQQIGHELLSTRCFQIPLGRAIQ